MPRAQDALERRLHMDVRMPRAHVMHTDVRMARGARMRRRRLPDRRGDEKKLPLPVGEG
jgi:hypothetical protein